MKFVFIIPTYNEVKNIGPLIEEICQELPEAEVLVVDDGSPDGTARVVRELIKQYPTLKLLERKGERGFASAYRAALQNILSDEKLDFIITMDADFSHHPRYLKVMLDKTPFYDLIIGSRYIAGGGVKNWNWKRRILSRLGNFYARIVLGIPIRDVTAGFMCGRVSFWRSIGWDGTRAEGYAWLMEIKMLFYRKGARITEIPIVFEERRSGASKISKNIIMEGIIYPLLLRFKRGY